MIKLIFLKWEGKKLVSEPESLRLDGESENSTHYSGTNLNTWDMGST